MNRRATLLSIIAFSLTLAAFVQVGNVRVNFRGFRGLQTDANEPTLTAEQPADNTTAPADTTASPADNTTAPAVTTAAPANTTDNTTAPTAEN